MEIPEGEINLESEFAQHYGFSNEHFSGDSYLWGTPAKKEVTISFVMSNEPGSGRFSHTVKKLLADGFRVVVPTPSNQMHKILTRWGFKGYLDPQDGCELWTYPPYPPAEAAQE